MNQSLNREPAVGIEPTTARYHQTLPWPGSDSTRNNNALVGRGQPEHGTKRPPNSQPNRNEARTLAHLTGQTIGDVLLWLHAEFRGAHRAPGCFGSGFWFGG